MCTNNALAMTSLPVVQDGLSHYLRTINNIPLLSEGEEYDLATRYQQQGDLQAAQKLVLAHLRYVAKIARGYNGYGLAFADLIQEGTIGLMKAVKRFDPTMGVRLVTFAMHWIKAEMHEFIIRNWRIVKMATTKAQRKLFFNLRKAKNRLGWFSAEEVNMVAEDLGVKPQEVLEMEKRLHAQDMGFDAPENDDEDKNFLVPANRLPALTCEPLQQVDEQDWQQKSQDKLSQALSTLDPRSKDIIQSRWLAEEKISLKVLAQKYNISIERVRQLEQAAMLTLREAIS